MTNGLPINISKMAATTAVLYKLPSQNSYVEWNWRVAYFNWIKLSI